MRREIRPEQFLARLPLFAGLGAAELERLAAATTRRELKRGEFLFRQGEPPTGFHAVVHGRIELRARSPHGHERVTDIVGAGRSFGEAIMFLDKPYIVSARARYLRARFGGKALRRVVASRCGARRARCGEHRAPGREARDRLAPQPERRALLA